jgi:hypothetical protein
MALAILAAALGAGCSVRRIENGVYHSPKGYRVAIPGPTWATVDSSDADLELRHRAVPAGIVANAECGRGAGRWPASVLLRHLLVGLSDRTPIERADVVLDGHPATRVVLEAAASAGAERLRIEAWTMSDGRCVYDLLYAAPPDRFPDVYPAFERFVGSFELEAR